MFGPKRLEGANLVFSPKRLEGANRMFSPKRIEGANRMFSPKRFEGPNLMFPKRSEGANRMFSPKSLLRVQIVCSASGVTKRRACYYKTRGNRHVFAPKVEIDSGQN